MPEQSATDTPTDVAPSATSATATSESADAAEPSTPIDTDAFEVAAQAASGSANRPETPTFAWTASQRRAILVVLVGLLALLAWRWWRNPQFVADPQPDQPAAYADLADRIDPNTADWQTLAALPNVGRGRAELIIRHREEVARIRPGQPAYRKPADLLAVKGIGYTMMMNLQPYLIFPGEPTTSPAATTTPPGGELLR